MAWYDSAVFYHIYPLGLCGCKHENTGEKESHFDQLNAWAKHAKAIGCNAIYIGPLFESGSHGYDTIDYRKVDCRLGSNEDFKQFVKNCHDMNMHVIVDGVFNHVGRDFFAFQDLKQNRENSRYRDWFCNVNFYGNNEYNDGFSYDNWGGYNLLVKLNQQNPEVKQYHFDSVRFWIETFDVDGIRLDAADVLDHGFMHDLRQFTDGIKDEFWLMGEVIHGDYSRWANGDMLHSVTNYELHKGLYSGHNDHNYFEIAHTIKRLNGLVGNTRLYTFTDNHDVERIYTKLNNKEHMYPVALLQYMVPGIPSIYYGSEFGIEGRKESGSDWNLRPCLNLDDFKDEKYQELLQLFTKLGKIKQEFKEVTYGDYQELLLTNRQFAFSRTLDGKAVITAVNNDDDWSHLEIPLPVDANKAVNLLTLEEEESVSDDSVEEEKAAAAYRAEKREQLEKQICDAVDNSRAIVDNLVKMQEQLSVIPEDEENVKDALHSYIALWQEQKDQMEESQKAIMKACDFKMPSKEPEADLTTCENLEIRDGRLVVDIAPNRGVVAYLTKE